MTFGSVTGLPEQLGIGSVTEKRKKDRDRAARGDEPLTAAHEAPWAEMDAQCGPAGRCDQLPVTAASAAKARAAGKPGPENPRGAYPGPGDFPAPDGISPQDFTRPYLNQGHSSPSPQSGPPCGFPVAEGQPSPADFSRGTSRPGMPPRRPRTRIPGSPAAAR